MGGGDLGDLGGEDLGGGDLGDLGGGDLGDLGGEGGEGEEAEPEALLATPPGRREDNPTKHEGARHKPVKSDKRQMGASGPRSRKLRSQAQGVETNTWRKNAGSGIGNPSTRNHKTDVRFGLEETSEATYTSDEHILFENTTKVRMLVEQLRIEELKAEEVDNDKT